MFENYRVFEYTLAGRPLVIETGKLAGLANGSCLVRYGETVVLACATASEKPRDGIDFLPLSVDFEERMYAAGKIPGGFIKREGRPSEKATLTSRLIDRPLRPLFNKGMRNDVQVVATVGAWRRTCPAESRSSFWERREITPSVTVTLPVATAALVTLSTAMRSALMSSVPASMAAASISAMTMFLL